MNELKMWAGQQVFAWDLEIERYQEYLKHLVSLDPKLGKLADGVFREQEKVIDYLRMRCK